MNFGGILYQHNIFEINTYKLTEIHSYFEKGCRIKCTRQPRKGWFWVHCFSKKFERKAGEAVDIYLRVLKESRNSYSVRNISHITFRDCRVHIFSDNLSRNSCICIWKMSTDVFPHCSWNFRNRLEYPSVL